MKPPRYAVYCFLESQRSAIDRMVSEMIDRLDQLTTIMLKENKLKMIAKKVREAKSPVA